MAMLLVYFGGAQHQYEILLHYTTTLKGLDYKESSQIFQTVFLSKCVKLSTFGKFSLELLKYMNILIFLMIIIYFGNLSNMALDKVMHLCTTFVLVFIYGHYINIIEVSCYLTPYQTNQSRLNFKDLLLQISLI